MKKLGEMYRDEVSGFEGKAVAQTEYLYGAEFDIGLEPTSLKDGKPMGVFWFRESRLKERMEYKRIGLGDISHADNIAMGPKAVPQAIHDGPPHLMDDDEPPF